MVAEAVLKCIEKAKERRNLTNPLVIVRNKDLDDLNFTMEE